MFKGRLGIWILVLLIAIGGPWRYEHIPAMLHTDDVAMSQEKIGHFKVQTTSATPDVIFTTDNTAREGYELVENAVTSPLVLYVIKQVDNYSDGFIQDDNNSYYLRINLRTILLAMEDGSTWQDIGISRKVVDGKVTLYIPDQNDWTYPQVVELFYMTLNGGQTPTEEQRAELQPRVEKLLSKCNKCPQIAQAIADEAANPSEGYKVFLAPEYLYMTSKGMGASDTQYTFVPVYFTKTVHVTANAYLKTGYEDIDLSHGLWEAMQSGKKFMEVTGWRTKDSKWNITETWSRFPNIA